MAQIFTVEQRGVGKPDYSKEVTRGIELSGYRLEYGESLFWMCIQAVAVPGPSILTRLPLAVGETMYALDCATGFPIATILAGWDFVIKEFWLAFNEDVYFEVLQGGTFNDISCCATVPAGVKPVNIFQQGWTRALLEDLAVASTFRVSVTNVGRAPAIGKVWVLGLTKRGSYLWL